MAYADDNPDALNAMRDALKDTSDDELKCYVCMADFDDVSWQTLDLMLEVLFERRGNRPEIDVAAAWEEFQRDYMGREETFPYYPRERGHRRKIARRRTLHNYSRFLKYARGKQLPENFP